MRGVAHWQRRERMILSLPLTPQVLQTLKSLSSEASLAVSQLCTMRSNFSGRSLDA
jgi:hypothetical protein